MAGRDKPNSNWTRTDFNFWLDSILLILFLALVWVSTIVRFVFPSTSDAVGWTLWGGSLDAWIGIQFGLVGTMAFAVLLHVMLHWTWVCGVVLQRLPAKRDGSKRSLDDGTRTIFGVGLMIVCLNIMGLAMAAAVLSIRGAP